MSQREIKPTSTSPYEYYQLYRHRIEHEDDVINHCMTWLLYIEAALIAFAAAASGAAWFGLVRQSEVLTYNSNYGYILATNAVASICFLGIQLALCYIGGHKVTKDAKARLDGAFRAWQLLIEEGDKVKTLWESQYRPSDEAFLIPPLAGGRRPDGLLLSHSGVNGSAEALRIFRLIWLFLFVVAVSFTLVEVCILFWAATGGRSILL